MTTEQASSPISVPAHEYDAWFETPLGRAVDAAEAAAVIDLARPRAGQRALDAGCGTGNYTRRLALAGLGDVTGVDVDEGMLAAARAKVPEAEFVAGNVRELPFDDGSFDLVISITVLCYGDPAREAVRELVRVTRPGGRIVLGELNRCSIWSAERRVRGWLGDEFWQGVRPYTARRLRGLLSEAGVRNLETRHAAYLPPHAPSLLIGRATTVERLGRLLGPVGAAFFAVGGDLPC